MATVKTDAAREAAERLCSGVADRSGWSLRPVLLRRIDPAAHPDLKLVHNVGDLPGGVLIERQMMSGMRYGVLVGLFATPLRVRYARRFLMGKARDAVSHLETARHTLAVSWFGGALCGVCQSMFEHRGWSDERIVAEAARLRRNKVEDRWQRITVESRQRRRILIPDKTR